MKVIKFLGSVFLLVFLVGVVGTFVTSLAGDFTPSEWEHAGTLAAANKLCYLADLIGFFGLSVVALVGWWTRTGKDQTAPTPPDLSRTADIPARTFSFRQVKGWAVVCRVLTVLFLLPLLIGLPLVLASGKADAKAVTAVVVGGLFMAAFAWVFWMLGRRYAGFRVAVDGHGVEVRTLYSTGRFTWAEITAFTKEEREIGAFRTYWFFVLYAGERALTVEPWIREADEFVAVVESATGQRLQTFPLNPQPAEHIRKWPRKAG